MSPDRTPAPDLAPALPDAFNDDEILPVFEANLDLPHMPAEANRSPETQQAE